MNQQLHINLKIPNLILTYSFNGCHCKVHRNIFIGNVYKFNIVLNLCSIQVLQSTIEPCWCHGKEIHPLNALKKSIFNNSYSKKRNRKIYTHFRVCSNIIHVGHNSNYEIIVTQNLIFENLKAQTVVKHACMFWWILFKHGWICWPTDYWYLIFP